MTTVLLGDVCSITMGQAPPGESYNVAYQGLPLVAGAGDFSGGRIAVKKYTSKASKVCQPGDIILSIRASIGAKVWAGRKYCLGRGVAGLRPQAPLDARYLWHWLSRYEASLLAKGRGATFLQVSRNDIAEMPMELPQLDEQRRIATILDQAESLRVTAKEAAVGAAAAIEAHFRWFFGDIAATATVEDIAAQEKGSIRTGPFGSQLLHSEFTAEGIAVLGIDNVVTNNFAWRERRYISLDKYEQLKRYTVVPGDVLITIMGTCGRCVVAPDDIPLAINTKHLCAITVNEQAVLPEFLRACFLWHPDARRHLKSHTKGAVMDGLNMGIIKSMPLPLPPMNAQTSFVNAATRIDEQVRKLAQRAHELDALADVLRARAFSGQL